MSLADIAGLAVPLGQWTLRAACVQGRKWQDAGHVGLAVSVNVSQRQLAHAALVKLVRRVLDETGLPPECLELEVRESELVRNPSSRSSGSRSCGGSACASRSTTSAPARAGSPTSTGIRSTRSRSTPRWWRRAEQPRPRGGDQRRDRARPLPTVEGRRRGRGERGAARQSRAPAVRPRARQPVRAAATAAETERLLLRQRQAARELPRTPRRTPPALVLGMVRAFA